MALFGTLFGAVGKMNYFVDRMNQREIAISGFHPANDVFSVTSCNDDSPVRIFYGGLRIIISKLLFL